MGFFGGVKFHPNETHLFQAIYFFKGFPKPIYLAGP